MTRLHVRTLILVALTVIATAGLTIAALHLFGRVWLGMALLDLLAR